MSSKEPAKNAGVQQRTTAPTSAPHLPAYDNQPLANALIERAQLAPRSLTPRDVLKLQRTMGNQVVGRLMAQTVQRKPIKVENNIYTDDKYPDVRLEKLKAHSCYMILNEGQYKGQVIYFDMDDNEYLTTEDDKEYGLVQTTEKFNIGGVSANPDVKPQALAQYDQIGAAGKGVGYVESDTALRTYGLNTCVGWLLYNDKAAYLMHILVEDPRKVLADGSIKAQVEKLYQTFLLEIGTAPTNLVIQVDQGQPKYEEKYQVWKLGWMQELVPASCAVVEWNRGAASLGWVVRASKGNRKEWNGEAIKLNYAKD
jgi:hypothetical protein